MRAVIALSLVAVWLIGMVSVGAVLRSVTADLGPRTVSVHSR